MDDAGPGSCDDANPMNDCTGTRTWINRPQASNAFLMNFHRFS